jgi:hypothetical protein
MRKAHDKAICGNEQLYFVTPLEVEFDLAPVEVWSYPVLERQAAS